MVSLSNVSAARATLVFLLMVSVARPSSPVTRIRSSWRMVAVSPATGKSVGAPGPEIHVQELAASHRPFVVSLSNVSAARACRAVPANTPRAVVKIHLDFMVCFL